MSSEEAVNKNAGGVEELDRHSLKWGLILFFLLILQVSLTGWYIVSDPELYHSLRLTYTLEYVSAFYPEEYHPAKMVRQAREAILEQLDRYSGYIEPRQMTLLNEEFGGSYGGIGITIIQHDKGLMITSVRDDGPAGRAGLLAGDIIIRADTVDLTDVTAYEATFYLRGPEGETVNIGILRDQFDTLQFTVTRQDLPLIHVPFAGITDNRNLYIRLLDFETGAAADIAHTLDTLYLPHEDSIGGIILDLRGNPGGLLDEALRIGDLFLEKGILIVGTKGRSRWVNEEVFSTGMDVTNGKPMIILVDNFSASASEIIAGSLKYTGRAILVGDTTFGKGLVQEYKGFVDGSGMRLTRSRYYFEGEKYINPPDAENLDSASGIPPDYFVDFPSQHPFVQELERTFLLREFAGIYSEDIIQFSPFLEKSPDWLERFKEYADDHHFNYASNTTMLATITRSLIAFEGYSESTFKVIDGIVKRSRGDDEEQFNEYRDYIKQRLYQIALEIEMGTPASYRLAILPYRNDIILAEELIKEQGR